MKKTIIYLIAALSLALGLVSCSNGKDDPKEFTLVGTKWVNIDKSDNEYTGTITLSFTDASKGVATIEVVHATDPSHNESEVANFTYIYKKPVLTITFTSGDAKGGIIMGTVDEAAKTMTCYSKEHPEDKAVFNLK